MQPKTSSRTVMRARIGIAEAMVWNQIRRAAGILPSSGIIVFLGTLWWLAPARSSRAISVAPLRENLLSQILAALEGRLCFAGRNGSLLPRESANSV
jgi:hypothetical protein